MAPGVARPGAPVGLPENGESGQRRMQYDYPHVLDAVRSTIQPSSWDEVGGPGTLAFFEPTLDFVCTATEEVQDQIDALFATLRRLPGELAVTGGVRPAKAAPIDQDYSTDFDSLIELIHSVVSPTTWDQVGGPGSIVMDGPHLALIVSQTQDVHDGLVDLLTLLRRSRYAAVHPQRPWETTPGIGDGTSPLPLMDLAAGADRAFALRLGCPRTPPPAALAALTVRHEPADGAWQWRRIDTSGNVEDTLSVRRSGRRSEFQLPQGTMRTDGDAAAIAYPGLALVELGNFAETARQAADGWLPWLPHRSNEELVRWFDVSPLAQEQTKIAVQLRLVPVGLSPTAGTYLNVSFDRRSGLPQSWESYVQDRLTGRLRFSDRVERGPTAAWRSVVLEDPSGKVLTRWTLLDSSPETRPIPALTEGWAGSLLLDRRAAEAAVDRPLKLALEAMGKSDWAAAACAVGCPLRRASRAAARGRAARLPLRVPPRSGRSRLCPRRTARGGGLRRTRPRPLHRRGQPGLAPARRALTRSLAAQPAAGRNAQDCDDLARAAMAAGRWTDALGHARDAVDVDARDGQESPRLCRLVKSLVASGAFCRCRQGRPRGTLAGHLAGKPLRRRPSQEWADVAELLARHGDRRTADELFGIALSAGDLKPPARHVLLLRRAGVRTGLPRWQCMAEAAALLPVGTPQRRHCVADLLAQWNEPISDDVVAALAKDADLRVHLRLRQAVLCPDPVRAGDILWQLSQSEELPKERFSWAWHLWNDTKRGDRVIHAAELWLRREGAAAIRPVGIGRGVPRGRPRWRRPLCRERSPVCRRPAAARLDAAAGPGAERGRDLLIAQ